ncbi:MAG: adenylate/guanylate cyclase domain-containing protein, partial [Rhodospirillaceae bacterium]
MVRRVRLVTGCILFAYVATHLLNHALGLVSLGAMEAARPWFLAVWTSPPGGAALYGSFLVHFALALWAIFQRRRLRLAAGEWVQLAVGLTIPFLLVEHIVGTRGATLAAGSEPSYPAVLLTMWVYAPKYVVIQALAILAAWTHGAIGLHYWMRLKPWYPDAFPLLYGAAILVPVLGFLGFVAAGREVMALAADPAWASRVNAAAAWPGRATAQTLQGVAEATFIVVPALLAAAFLARFGRTLVERRRGVLRIGYPDGRAVTILPGATILDASRAGGIPHASVCGGRGRCSTCRVRVTLGAAALPMPGAVERRVLVRVGAPPDVRLACQARPTADLSVIPLLPATATAADGFARAAYLMGQEKEIAILFADLRDFTGFAERKLPYDVVFVLNRYFAGMGEAVTQAGGHLDKFIGDGVMALFGVEGGLRQGCRQSLAAARAMAERLDELNRALAHDLERPLRIGIGIHVGPVIIGEMGYGRASGLTAIGDAVNTASRLETLTKQFACQLVVSEAV